MQKIKFTREFTSGNLKGIRHEDSIATTNADLVDDWLKCINDNNKAGLLDYKIVAYKIVNEEDEIVSQMQRLRQQFKIRIDKIVAAKKALSEVKELCEEGGMMEGCYSDLDHTARKLDEIVGGLECTIEHLESFK